MTRLEAFATTASLQLDGNQLEYLQISYEKENAVMTNHQDRIYQLLHEALLEIKEQNNLNASIYTLFREDGNFYFGVNSESKAHFSYKYEHFPKELETNYKVGGSVDVYED